MPAVLASPAPVPTPPGIRTKATKVDGGWKVTGQKVWTTGAAQCNRGLATVRTDPDKPKHDGITMMVIDLHAPGVDIRPLREATGHELFNEVFFDDVFVSDEDVVGPVDGGWKVARSTLGNERVSIGGGGGGIGDALFDLLDLAHRYADDTDGLTPAALEARRAAAVGARQHAPAQPALRAKRAVAGGEPGPEGNVAKLLSAPSTASVKRRWRCGSSARPVPSPRARTRACRRRRSSPAASPSPAAPRRSCAARSANASSASPATPCSADQLLIWRHPCATTAHY